MKIDKKNVIDFIINFESGTLTAESTIYLFSYLIKSGTIKGLQGVYHRTANQLIKSQYLTLSGNINKDKLNDLIKANK
jgi:hypothetical protein